VYISLLSQQRDYLKTMLIDRLEFILWKTYVTFLLTRNDAPTLMSFLRDMHNSAVYASRFTRVIKLLSYN
jgi:hypothetical protein